MTDTERQNISALAQIATGLAWGLAGGSSNDAAQGALVGKNAVENNYLTPEQKELYENKYNSCSELDFICKDKVALEEYTLF